MRPLANIFGHLIALLWQCARLPLFVLLLTLEPVVGVVVGALALLGVLMAFFWWSMWVTHFHFALLLGTSLGLGALPFAYQTLLRMVSR